MNTGTQTAFADLSIDKPNLENTAQDMSPLEVRWGFQMVQRDKHLSAYECGVSKVPFGKFFPIATKQIPKENHTIDWTQPKESPALLKAADAEAFLMEALGGAGAQNKTNWGLKTAFRGESDAAKMAVISETLLPTLPRIREICQELQVSVISDVCEGSDDLDYGQRDTCITCWWKWLNSPAIQAHMENVAMTGMTVSERDPATGEQSQRLVRPSITELRSALEVVIESGKQGIKQLQSQWNDIASEYEKADGIRKDISEFEHGYRKDLHQNKPQDRQFALAREIAKGTNAQAGGNADLLAALAQSQIETNRLLQQMAANQAGGGMKLAPTSEIPAITSPTPIVQTVTMPEDLAETVTGTADAVETGLEDLAPAAQKMEEAKKAKTKEK